MVLILLVITIIYACVTFISSQPQEQILNPFFAYFATEVQFLIKHALFFSLGVFLILLFIIRSKNVDEDYAISKKLFLSTWYTLQVIVLGFFLSYLFLFFIAFLQLNVLALVININPKIAGVQTSRKDIVDTLKTNSKPPLIVAGDTTQAKEVLAVATATTGKSSLYGESILPSIPSFFVLPLGTVNSSMMLVANTVVVIKINPTDLQAVSPIIGSLFLQQYFPNRHIKSYPKITIMNRQEYQKYRREDADKKLAILDDKIKKIESEISSLSAMVQQDENNIAEINQTYTQRKAAYKQCLSGGKPSSSCKELLSQVNIIAKQGNTDITSWSQRLENSQKQLLAYQYYQSFFASQKKVVQTQTENLPYELGVFEPNDSIKVALDTTNPHAIADYFETVTHEYLHYASFVSKERTLRDPFFEEGLTEYFARATIKDSLDISTNLGYPVQAKIIREMTKIIPESELADIYFTKDESRLEAALNRVYGDGFYEKNQFLFATLQYTSDPKQVVKLANTIMEQIGGTPLKEKDLVSTHSNL